MNADRAELLREGFSNGSDAVTSPRDAGRIVAALEEYFQLLRDGERPSRSEFLARHQSIADVLADRIDGLEFVQDAAGSLAETRSVDGAIDDVIPMARLGEYRIIREVGRGGMGVVYEAEQLPLDRRVALKVLPTTASLDPRQRQRFQVEAQAAALFHHEHIVPIFGIGRDHGVHYYAMQFIEGRSLTDLIGSLRAVAHRVTPCAPTTSAGTPSLFIGTAQTPHARSSGSSFNNRQHFRAAARLGLQAALALEHAHEIGVIHRDIKPSNLLIDSRDHLWVTDFGLARLPHGDHDLTRTGDLVGTIRYMSPEQLRGERGRVNASTDIYALGVTLYELLTLRPAFDGRDRHELLRRIVEEEPASPRHVNVLIPRDLETIVLKSMEKEPSARYVSARELADDLKRFLEDQPIQARRPGLVDRAVKWSRRHRAAVATAAAALVVTLSTSTAVLWEAKRRTDVTLDKYKKTRHEQQLAIQKSLGALDQFAHFSVQGAGAGSRSGQEVKQTLTVAIAYYDDLTRIFAADDGMQEVVAKAFRQAGLARMSLGAALGRDNYRQAIHVYEHLVLRYADRIWYRTSLIETLQEYHGLLTRPADAIEADASFRRALEVAEALIGDNAASQHCFRSGLVGPFNSLAWTVVRRPPVRASDASVAIRLARQAVEWESDQSALWNTLGVAYYRAGNWSSAARALQKSMDLSHGGNATDWFFSACIAQDQGDAVQARRWYDRAVAWVQQHAVPDQAQAGELLGFRDEAARTLGLAGSTDERAKSARDILRLPAIPLRTFAGK